MGLFNKNTSQRNFKSVSIGVSAKHKEALEFFKSEIEAKQIKFPKELGEEHPFEFETVEGMYVKFGMVTGVIDKIVDFIWGPGFFTKSNNERAKEIIDQWMQDVDFAFHGKKWCKQGLIKGTSVMELGGIPSIRGKTQTIKGVKTLNSNNVFIKRDKKGKIVQVNQAVGGIKNFTKKKVIPFKPEQVAIYTVNPIGDNVYGHGIIFPALTTLELLLSAQKSMHTLMKRKANSPLVAKIGDKEKESFPTNEDLDAFSTKMQFMNDKTEWAVPDDVELSVLEFGNISEKFTGLIDHDIDMLFFTFQVPEVLMGRGNIPEGLAKVQLEAFDRLIRSRQAEIEKVIEEKIFRRVLQANGLDAHVEFEWGQPSNSEVNEKIKQITELLKLPMIGENLRLELEKRLANLLDIDEKVIEDDDDQREREEEEEQPGVPGANQSVEGDLIEQ